jgi:hypothetical protein
MGVARVMGDRSAAVAQDQRVAPPVILEHARRGDVRRSPPGASILFSKKGTRVPEKPSVVLSDGTLESWNPITASSKQIDANVDNAAALVSPIRPDGAGPRFLLLGGQVFSDSPVRWRTRFTTTRPRDRNLSTDTAYEVARGVRTLTDLTPRVHDRGTGRQAYARGQERGPAPRGRTPMMSPP